MRTHFRLSDLIPPALAAESVSENANAVIVCGSAPRVKRIEELTPAVDTISIICDADLRRDPSPIHSVGNRVAGTKPAEPLQLRRSCTM